MRNLQRIGLGLLLAGPLALAQQYAISTIAGGVPPATPVAATGTSIGQPQRVTTDKTGNLYFSSGNSVFKMTPGGTLTLIAGNSRAGFTGDGGPAVNAQLNAPRGVAVGPTGAVYIADSGNNRVRVVTPDGLIATIAGNGTPGYSGDGGSALSAQLHLPTGVVVDPSGFIFIADSANYTIRRVYPDGSNIITWVGNGYPGSGGDTGAASEAQINIVEDISLDAAGNLYIADTGNNTVRMVNPKLTITTIGGNAAGTNTITTDGGQATLAVLYSPFSVVADSSGNVYFTEYATGKIREINTKGIISTVAGTGTPGFSGDGGPAAKGQLGSPTGIARDASGNLYIADQVNLRVRAVATSGNLSTVAGNGTLSFSGDGGPASKAQLDTPNGAAVDAAGNVYVSDSNNHRVRKIAPGGTITTVAGNGTAGFGGDGGPGTSAQLDHPFGLALDAAGNLYIADADNNRVRMLAPSGTITTFAGNGTPGFGGDGGQAASAMLNSPVGLARDSSGNLYIAELSNNRVRKVSSTGVISTVAGTGLTGYSGDNGPSTQAALNGPFAVAVDARGNLYIADTGNNRIRMVTFGEVVGPFPGGQGYVTEDVITTAAGNGLQGYFGDGGPSTSAQLLSPVGVLADTFGNLYIADSSARIRKVSPDRTIGTIAGTGTPGYAGDGGMALSAQLNSPSALALDAAGNLYVADTGNSAVRLLQPTGYQTAISAVTNAASNLTGAVAPGELVVLYGSNLGPAQLVQFQLVAGGLVSTSLSGTRVLFNGTPAPILYASATQVAAIVPYETTGANVQVVAQYGNQTSAPVSVAVASSNPGVFTLDSSGKGQAAAITTGSVVTLYVTGEGQTSPAGTDGLPAPNPAPKPVLPVTVTIGGQNATVQYAGGAPGLVEGVMQVNVTVPSGVTGAAPVVVKVGTASSQPGVTIAVGGS